MYFLQRTVWMGYLLPDSPDAAALIAKAESRLLASVALRSHHVLRPLFPLVLTQRPGLHPCPNDFTLPNKDDYNLFQESFAIHYFLSSSLIFISCSAVAHRSAAA